MKTLRVISMLSILILISCTDNNNSYQSSTEPVETVKEEIITNIEPEPIVASYEFLDSLVRIYGAGIQDLFEQEDVYGAIYYDTNSQEFFTGFDSKYDTTRSPLPIQFTMDSNRTSEPSIGVFLNYDRTLYVGGLVLTNIFRNQRYITTNRIYIDTDGSTNSRTISPFPVNKAYIQCTDPCPTIPEDAISEPDFIINEPLAMFLTNDRLFFSNQQGIFLISTFGITFLGENIDHTNVKARIHY